MNIRIYFRSTPNVITNINCRYYRGHIPCVHHKESGTHCHSCDHYEALQERILIIKLGAIGDVIRTTPLIRKLKQEYPNAEITWLTYSPEVVPKNWVDNILDFTLINVIWLERQEFDWLINLDKDREAIAIAVNIKAKRKSGFQMNKYGKCIPMGSLAEKEKWLTGLWDDLNRLNTLNYMEEIFSICGFSFSGEEYILELKDLDIKKNQDKKSVVGLNTGCGARWITRLWPEAYWIELAGLLKDRKYEVMILGGPPEDEKNKRIASASGTDYYGVMVLEEFFKHINKCDIIVTQVTMAMHVAIALKKYLVLMNNIFNKNEFFLYNNGVILEPDLDCLGCFKQQYNSTCSKLNCMEMIVPTQVVAAIDCRNNH